MDEDGDAWRTLFGRDQNGLAMKKTRQKWISEPICGLFTYNYTSYPIPPIEEEFKITW